LSRKAAAGCVCVSRDDSAIAGDSNGPH
jgi:hypothetical protein